jgi:hypothetical protein
MPAALNRPDLLPQNGQIQSKANFFAYPIDKYEVEVSDPTWVGGKPNSLLSRFPLAFSPDF